MSWSIVHFGKHKGQSLPQIVFKDPDWFFWAVDDEVFLDKGWLAVEAIDVARKARSIRIPDTDGQRYIAVYIVNPSNRKFSHLEIIPADHCDDDLGDAFRSRVIDLSVPRKIARYDKLGCRNVLWAAKRVLFGSARVKMTRQRCEDFFDNDANFVLGDG